MQFARIPALALAATGLVSAQIVVDQARHPHWPWPPPHWPPPHWPRVPVRSDAKVRSVEFQASVKDQAARVQVSQVFENPHDVAMEAQLLFPLPDEAAVGALTLVVDGKELTGKLMRKEEARRIYEEIVGRRRDPALLEYMGRGLYQSSVFPVPPRGQRTVQIRYTQLLRKDNGLVDLLLPLGAARPEKLEATVRVETSEPIKTLYSPTHSPEITRPDPTHAVVKLALAAVKDPADFRLFYGTAAGAVGMNVLSYKPQDSEDGYFLLLAAPDVKLDRSQRVPKTMIYVLDRSGSMTGQKIEQAKAALKFLLNQLAPADTFNIIAYDSSVESFRPEIQRADEATVKAALQFADGLYAGGSTNIDGALQAALKMLTDPRRPSYVLFLTDGLPTAGETREVQIATRARDANAARARLFSFGVGYDVNSRLLDRLSRDLRGQSVYVRPNESIEAHVSSLHARIGAPLLTDIAVDFGALSTVSRLYPRQLTDLFQGEQLVLVGRYRQGGSASVTLNGAAAGKRLTFSTPATFVQRSADESNGFIERLWATRRIGEIIDELDLHGHNRELIDELVQLSQKHGILTPYTSFLADDRVLLSSRAELIRRASEQAVMQLDAASGLAGFAQRAQKGAFMQAAQAALAGAVQDAEGRTRMVETIRQLGQKTFFKRDRIWQEATLNPDQMRNAIRLVQFSRDYFDLAASHGGALAKYLVFEEPVVVNLGGKIYQIEPPDTQ